MMPTHATAAGRNRMVDILSVSYDDLKLAFEVLHEHLATGAPVSPGDVLDEISALVSSRETKVVIALFKRATALQNLIEDDDARAALQAISDGDGIPDAVFEAAAVLPVIQTDEGNGNVSSDFEKGAFVEAVRGPTH
jgi:hypothetical protein